MIKFTKSITTHQAMLIKSLLYTKGTVMELGGGPFSTPLLHWLCKAQNRSLITYENDWEFYKYLYRFKSRQHSVRFIKDWDAVSRRQHFGVVFLDHAPANRRAVDAINLKDKADIIVIHDSQATDCELDGVWQHFKYRHDWGPCKPFTTVVSNTIDVSKWDDNIPYLCD